MKRLLPLIGLVVLPACGDAASPVAPFEDAPIPYFGYLDPLPATLEERVCGFVADLDELLVEFSFAADFDDDRLNRALDRAETVVERARDASLTPDLTGAMRDLRAAMRELEKGASLTSVSGHGFADDLASLGSFIAQRFTEDLIAMVSVLAVAPPDVVSDATDELEEGVADRGSGEWEEALAHFGRAIRELEREVTIGAPCA